MQGRIQSTIHYIQSSHHIYLNYLLYWQYLVSIAISSRTYCAAKVVTCHYGLSCHIFTSRQEGSYERKFYKNSWNRSLDDCTFFRWVDESKEATTNSEHVWRRSFKSRLSQRVFDLYMKQNLVSGLNIVIIILFLISFYVMWCLTFMRVKIIFLTIFGGILYFFWPWKLWWWLMSLLVL